jgi:hypothetical protein
MRVLILSSFLIQDDSVAMHVEFAADKATFGNSGTCLVKLTLPASSPEPFTVSVDNLDPCIVLGKDKYQKSDLPPFWDDSEEGVIGRKENGKIICERRIEKVYSEFATFTGQIPEVGEFFRGPLIPSRVCRIMAHKYEEVKYLAIEKALKKTEAQRKVHFLKSFNACLEEKASSAEPIDLELEGSSLESWAKILSSHPNGNLDCIDSAVDSVIDSAERVIALSDGASAVIAPNDMETKYSSFEEAMVFQLRVCLRDTSSVKDMMDMILERSISHGEKAEGCLESIRKRIQDQQLEAGNVFARKIEANRVLNCFYGANKSYKDCIVAYLGFTVPGRQKTHYLDPKLEALYKCMSGVREKKGIDLNEEYSSCFGSARWAWSRQRVIPEVEAVICVGKNFLEHHLRLATVIASGTNWEEMTKCA